MRGPFFGFNAQTYQIRGKYCNYSLFLPVSSSSMWKTAETIDVYYNLAIMIHIERCRGEEIAQKCESTSQKIFADCIYTIDTSTHGSQFEKYSFPHHILISCSLLHYFPL